MTTSEPRKANFSAEELSEILCSYDLGEYRSHQVFSHGDDQTNILLVTDEAKFAFRYYEKRSEEYALFEIDLLRYLGRRSYPSPSPLKNRQGGFVGNHNGKPFAIFQFLDGEYEADEGHYREVARAIGKLHQIMAGYKPEYAEARDTYDPVSCWASATANSVKFKSWTKAQAKLAWLEAELGKLQLPTNMPEGVCHGDPNPSNFLYANGHLSAVLDFDQASYTYLLYDVANMIYWWTWPNNGELNFAKTKLLLAEYENERQLTETEKEHLYDMLKMVNLMGAGWFLYVYEDDDYSSGQRKVESLNEMGREEFYKEMFLS